MRLLPIVLFALAWLQSCMEPAEDKSEGIYCSAEKVETIHGQKKFKQGTHVFGNGQTRSSAEAKTGTYSSKATKISPYSFDFELINLQPGDKVIATVWRKGGKGVLAVKNGSGYYKQASEPVLEEGGWEKLKLELLIDDYNFQGKYLLHCWLPDAETPCFFDDFRVDIQRLNRSKLTIPANADVLHISMSEEAKAQLQNKRDEAIDNGLIVKSKDSWVGAKVKWEGREANARIRLKGDMLDHVRGKKWSFRVDLKEDALWKNMTEFSLQNPVTRGYLYEWYFHQLLKQEGLLTPQYGFVFLVVNQDTLGLYSYEEHFTAQLLTSQNTAIAPILKFDEDLMWEVRKENSMEDVVGLPTYESSAIKAYGGTQNEHLPLAMELFRQYKFGADNLADVVSVDKTAKYLAALDLSKAYHALIWHNQRWYFNPSNQRLEPIGYDGYTHNGPYNWIEAPYLGHNFPNNQKLHGEEITRLLFDSLMYSAYIAALQKLAAEDYVTGFLQNTKKQAAIYEQWIQAEYPDFTFDHNFIAANAREIQSVIQKEEPPETKDQPIVQMKWEGVPSYPQVFFRAVVNGKELEFCSFYPLPVKVVGVGNSSQQPDTKLNINLPAYAVRQLPKCVRWQAKQPYSFAFFLAEGSKEIYAIPVLQ